jgi:hypothetical protein
MTIFGTRESDGIAKISEFSVFRAREATLKLKQNPFADLAFGAILIPGA